MFVNGLLHLLAAAWHYLIKVYEWKINNGQQGRDRICITVQQVLNNE